MIKMLYFILYDFAHHSTISKVILLLIFNIIIVSVDVLGSHLRTKSEIAEKNIETARAQNECVNLKDLYIYNEPMRFVIIIFCLFFLSTSCMIGLCPTKMYSEKEYDLESIYENYSGNKEIVEFYSNFQRSNTIYYYGKRSFFYNGPVVVYHKKAPSIDECSEPNIDECSELSNDEYSEYRK